APTYVPPPSPPPEDVTPTSNEPGAGRKALSAGCTLGTAGVVGIPIVLSPVVMLVGFAVGIWGFVQWVGAPGLVTTGSITMVIGAAIFGVGLGMFLVTTLLVAPVAGKMLNSLGLMNSDVASAINSGVRTVSFGMVGSCL
ncbi:MAG: hypothetical protein AB2A00_36145, partial [Myxococcota bacterium]